MGKGTDNTEEVQKLRTKNLTSDDGKERRWESKMEGAEQGMTLGHWNVSQRTCTADPFFQRDML